jgi:hypothetical protein
MNCVSDGKYCLIEPTPTRNRKNRNSGIKHRRGPLVDMGRDVLLSTLAVTCGL